MIYEFHRYANIFPMANNDDFSRLVDDIKKNGLLEPIWLYEGKILDGRNRYNACKQVDVNPKFQWHKGGGDSEAILFVFDAKKRNGFFDSLNSSQRAIYAAKIKTVLDSEARESKRKKNEWLKKARSSFAQYKNIRKPCAVCGKYQALTEAHHIYPLAWQYDNGLLEPNHDHLWLCPTHHKLVHLNIKSHLKSNQSLNMKDTPIEEIDAIHEISALTIAKYLRLQGADSEILSKEIGRIEKNKESIWAIQ